MINSLQPWTPAPHRTPALPAGHRDGVAGGARGCGENTRTPAHVCLPEGHRDGVRHSAGRPQLLGLRLTRLACGKLGVYCLPEWPAMAGGVPEGPGSSPHRTRDGCPQGCFADPLRGRYAELEAVGRQ